MKVEDRAIIHMIPVHFDISLIEETEWTKMNADDDDDCDYDCADCNNLVAVHRDGF